MSTSDINTRYPQVIIRHDFRLQTVVYNSKVCVHNRKSLNILEIRIYERNTLYIQKVQIAKLSGSLNILEKIISLFRFYS